MSELLENEVKKEKTVKKIKLLGNFNKLEYMDNIELLRSKINEIILSLDPEAKPEVSLSPQKELRQLQQRLPKQTDPSEIAKTSARIAELAAFINRR